MTKSRLVVCMALAAVLGSLTASGQKPAQVDLGFKADGLYQFSGLDSVNLFNGNLIVQIPIGSSYGVDGGLKYGLTLVYNSKVWDYDETRDDVSGQVYTTSYPNWRSNAGVGWRLSMGRLIGSTDPTANYSRWVYEGPTGEEHVLVENYEQHPRQAGRYWYAVGEQRLRLVKPLDTEVVADYPSDHVRLLEFPDGTVHTFTLTCKSWQLRKIGDRFGNFVRITPSCDSENRVFLWTLNDSVGRTHTVGFVHQPTTATSVDRGQHVETITLATAAGPLPYRFIYDADPAVDWGCDHSPDPDMKLSTRASVPLLKSIILPDQTAFSFEYYRSKTEGGYCAQGAMRKLTVPTGGEFAYTYQLMHLPEDFCFLPRFPSRNPGVRTRTTPDGRWDYLATVSAELTVPDAATFCRDFRILEPNEMRTPGVDPLRRWARMTVLAPPIPLASGAVTRMRTDTYFHAWTDAPLPPAFTDEWNRYDQWRNPFPAFVRFGQPVTTGAPPVSDLGPVAGSTGYSTETADKDARVDASSDVHYLSTRTFEGCADEVVATGRCEHGRMIRSTYQRLPPVFGDFGRSTYPAESMRTVDDQGGWIQTSATVPDGYGKYKTSTTSSNSSGTSADGFTTTTNYLGPATGGEWLLNRYDYTTRSEGGVTMRTDYRIDATTGFLDAIRTRLDATSLKSNDVLTLFSGTKGNVEVEKSYGGDTACPAPLYQCTGRLFEDAARAFTPPDASPQYLAVNTFSRGALVKSQACDPAGSVNPCSSILTKVDVDLHPSGSPIASRDSSGVQTNYGYDEYGRLKTVNAPGPSTTTYVYTAATASSNAKVRETVTGSASAVLSETLYEFDRLGRPVRITRSMPDQKAATVVTKYDALGRRIEVTQPSFAGAPVFSTKTTYDALGRPALVEGPDGKKTTFRYGGEQWMERIVPVATSAGTESDVTVREDYDAQRRLIRVQEYSGGITSPERPVGDLTATTYAYDVGGRLTKVVMGEQTRTFTYDLRGFLKDERHPESGTTTYRRHDSRGHAQTLIYDNATVLSFEYDAAERLTRISDAAGTLKSFGFAAANTDGDTNKKAGKLITTTRRNDVVDGTIEVKEDYEYLNPIGQLSLRKTSVEKIVVNGNTTTRYPIQTFAHRIPEYDELRLPKKIAMPTCSLHGCSAAAGIGEVTYERDAGYLKSVIGYASLSYGSSGAVTRVEHQLNASRTTSADLYEPDSGMARPSMITLGGAACRPPAPAIQASGEICPGKTGTASVAALDGATYAWTIQGGTFTSAANASTVTFQASSGSISLGVTMTNACGSASHSKAIASTSNLAAPVITAPAAACANTSVNASVPANPDLTYTWTMSPGSWTATGPNVTFTAPSTAFTLMVTAQNSCGGTASASRQIDVAPPASARLYLTNPVFSSAEASRVRGTSESVTLKVEFPEESGSWEIAWSDGVRETTYRNPHERVVAPEKFTEYRVNSVTPQRCGEPTGIVYVNVLPPAPARVTAATQPDGKVFVSWTSVLGAAGYSIERADRKTSNPVQIYVAAVDATSYLYTPPANMQAPAVHFYYVRTIDPEINPGYEGPKSPAVAFDHAITGTVPEANTFIIASDILRLRSAIDAYRYAFGIPPASYPAAPVSQGWFAAADVTDLVVRLNHARPATDPFIYRDVPPPTPRGIFYRDHLQQLWDALR